MRFAVARHGRPYTIADAIGFNVIYADVMVTIMPKRKVVSEKCETLNSACFFICDETPPHHTLVFRIIDAMPLTK